MSAEDTSPQPLLRSLRTRIVRHFMFFTLLMAVALAAGAWFFLMEAEDASLESLLARTLEDQLASPREAQRWPGWIQRFDSPAALLEVLPLNRVPLDGGPYPVFANADHTQAVLVDSWNARLRTWALGLESEYRLHLEPSPSSRPPVCYLADWQALEHTETIPDRLRRGLLIFAGIMGLLSLALGRRLARSAIQPVLDLADKVRARHASSEPLATGMAEAETALLARSLDNAFAQLSRANERERQFIADCSHELRTPLTILSGAVTLLSEREGADAAVLARLRRTTRRMEAIARTFLVIAREGRLPGPREHVPLRETILQVLDEQQLVYPHPPSQIRVSVPAEIRLSCVREVLHVILGNLLGNALQHAPDQPLRIDWEPTRPPSLHFQQDETPAPPGTTHGPREPRPSYGIGLSLVRRLCELQQWQLETHSAPSPHFIIRFAG